MSILILQIIIKQWDKSKRTADHLKLRAEIPSQYIINSPPGFYVFNNQCVIDQHGDDLLGDRVTYSQNDKGKIKFDRYQVCLHQKTLEYTSTVGSDKDPKTIGSIDNKWIQCRYDWRYSVYEGGFYYWLYEEVVLNAICTRELDENIFLNSNPAIIFTG